MHYNITSCTYNPGLHSKPIDNSKGTVYIDIPQLPNLNFLGPTPSGNIEFILQMTNQVIRPGDLLLTVDLFGMADCQGIFNQSQLLVRFRVLS